jgi:hypothetical protein
VGADLVRRRRNCAPLGRVVMVRSCARERRRANCVRRR